MRKGGGDEKGKGRKEKKLKKEDERKTIRRR